MVSDNPETFADLDGHDPWDIVMYVATHVAMVGVGIQATRHEYQMKVRNQTTSAGRDAVKAEMRGKGPALGREMAKQAAQDPARTAGRAAKSEAQLAESITRTSTEANATAKAFGTAGRVPGALAVGVATYEIATAPAGQKMETAGKEGTGIAGAMSGGELGAEVGSYFGPYGAAAGGLLGSILGGVGGENLANQVLKPSEPDPNANGNGTISYTPTYSPR